MIRYERCDGIKRYAARVATLCQSGAYGFDHSKPVERLWMHAEEFIEQLELATDDAQKRKELCAFALNAVYEEVVANERSDIARNIAENFSGQLQDRTNFIHFKAAALQFLAAEVCGFLEGADLEQERWYPYNWWARLLGGADTVITFNYDQVPNKLSHHLQKTAPVGFQKKSGFWIPTPDQSAANRSGDDEAKAAFLKLHGSVDWRLTAEREIFRVDGPDADCGALVLPANEQAIATPGPRKRTLVDGNGPLSPLWRKAASEIRSARVLVFIGYRVPPSDAYTRDWIARHIRANAWLDQETWRLAVTAGPPTAQPLYIHTVLGDDVNHKDSRRLKGFLEALAPRGRIKVKQWPMFAEDFLGIINREMLIDPHQFEGL